MNNFRFHITQFRSSIIYFVIEMQGYKYNGVFEDVFCGISSLVNFIKNVSENKVAVYENEVPNAEHVLKYTPNTNNSGQLKLMNYYYYDDGEKKSYNKKRGIFCEMNISRYLLVNEIFLELKKLYRSAEFNAHQIEAEEYERYPVWDFVSAKVIEEYLCIK